MTPEQDDHNSMFKKDVPWDFDKTVFTLGLYTGLVAAVKDGGQLNADQRGLARRALGDLSRLYNWLTERHQAGELQDAPPLARPASGNDREELHLT